MSKLWSGLVRQLNPYIPGEQPKEQGLIKLNTNENPYAPSPGVLDVFFKETGEELRLYPDPNSIALKQAIAKTVSVETKNIFVGNGSDEVLALAFMAFFKQKNPLLFPDISYSFYSVYCNLLDIKPKTVPLAADFSINVDDYIQANGGIIFPNPNAPTGVGLPLEKIETLLQANTNTVVIVDEAYIDFGGESAVALIDRYPNLLVVQTLSKSRSLAGLRVGFAIGDIELIEGLDRVKNSFNSYPIDRIAEKTAIAALNDQSYFEECTAKIIATREHTTQQLQQLGFEVLPSQANFVFAKPEKLNAETVFSRLREEKIIVRYFNKPRISDYLRITIGTDEEMETLVTALRTMLE